LTACGGAGQVAQGPSPDAQCFWTSQISGFHGTGPNRAVLRIGSKERYELTVSSGCNNLDWAQHIALVPRGGGERICPGEPAELLAPSASGGSVQRCLVSDIRVLPQPAETPSEGSGK
jgi:hypothetical protein